MGSTLNDLPALFLLCYAYGHRWDHAGGQMLEGGMQEDQFDCQCGGHKWEVWNVKTKRTWGRPRYARPAGYSLGYRITREDAKQALRQQGWDDFKMELAKG